MLKLESLFRCGLPFLYGFSFLPRAGTFGGCKFLPPISYRMRTSELSEGVYTCSSLFLGISTGWSPDVFDTVTVGGSMTDHLIRFHKISVISRSAKYLCGTHVLPGANVSRHFLCFYFLFLTDSYYAVTNCIFYWRRFWSSQHIFLFRQHVFVRHIPNFF